MRLSRINSRISLAKKWSGHSLTGRTASSGPEICSYAAYHFQAPLYETTHHELAHTQAHQCTLPHPKTTVYVCTSFSRRRNHFWWCNHPLPSVQVILLGSRLHHLCIGEKKAHTHARVPVLLHCNKIIYVHVLYMYISLGKHEQVPLNHTHMRVHTVCG